MFTLISASLAAWKLLYSPLRIITLLVEIIKVHLNFDTIIVVYNVDFNCFSSPQIFKQFFFARTKSVKLCQP